MTISQPLTKDGSTTGCTAQGAGVARQGGRTPREWPASIRPNIIGRSEALAALKSQLPTLAMTEAVVIYGSRARAGAVAHAIHALSKRGEAVRHREWCTLNRCSSPAVHHRRGGFTDAHRDTPGVVDAAHTGTLFDEIGEIAWRSGGSCVSRIEVQAAGSPKMKITVSSPRRTRPRARRRRTDLPRTLLSRTSRPCACPRSETAPRRRALAYFLAQPSARTSARPDRAPRAPQLVGQHPRARKQDRARRRWRRTARSVSEQMQLGRAANAAPPFSASAAHFREKKEAVALRARVHAVTFEETRGHGRAPPTRGNRSALAVSSIGIRADSFR